MLIIENYQNIVSLRLPDEATTCFGGGQVKNVNCELNV